MLKIQDLTKTYKNPEGGTLDALKDVSLTVKTGEFVAVYGPSGCGKTTLLLSAGGLLHPSSGDIILADRNLYAMNPTRRAEVRASEIGFVFQQFHLIPYLNVLENVLAPALVRMGEKPEDRAHALIEQFGLTDRIHHLPGSLSTGERQRTALARALLNSPKLLLADEPTGNLDEVNGAAVLEHLGAFARDGGAVLLVTHDREARKYANRTVTLNKGEVEHIEE